MSDINIADLFAGGGGFSTGVAAACRQIDKNLNTVAVNHWEVAARTYKRNHPAARVLCTGLDAVIPTQEVPSGRLDLLAASPECTHHSNARGGRPMNDQSRASAWLILKWLQELYVESVLIENVHEFANWGPLGVDGRPLKRMRGALFDQFINSLKSLGYNVEWRVLNAADYGGATTRERLFIMARRGRNKRIVWPNKTHAPNGDVQSDLFGDKQRWRAARQIIDWGTPSQSIFTRKKPLAPATMERIAAGLRKFGGKAAEPFLVTLRQHMGARSIDDPVPTLTASGRHIGVCQPFIFNMQRAKDPHLSVDRPMPTVTASSNDYGLVQPFIAELRGGKDANSVDQPLSTVTTKGAHHGLVEPFLVEYRGNHFGRSDGDRRVKPVTEPLPTQTTENRFGLLEPLVMSYYGTNNITPVSQPLRTVTSKDRFGLIQFADGLYLDIHFRMLTYRELANAMGFPDSYGFEGTRSDKVRMIGNSVEVYNATALARAALAA